MALVTAICLTVSSSVCGSGVGGETVFFSSPRDPCKDFQSVTTLPIGIISFTVFFPRDRLMWSIVHDIYPDPTDTAFPNTVFTYPTTL